MTPGGQYLNSLKLYDNLPQNLADDIWGQASRYYSSGASGEVNWFINGARYDRVFHTIEKPILLQNPSVTGAVSR
jgi:hypothetical protein